MSTASFHEINRKFSTGRELLARLSESGLSLPDFMVARDALDAGLTVDAVRAELAQRIRTTRHALERGIATPQYSFSGMTQAAACKFLDAADRTAGRAPSKDIVAPAKDSMAPAPLPVQDRLFALAIGYALAVNEVNACGGRIVAFPTAGACGIVPGVLWAWRDARCPELGPETKLFQDAFVVASTIGILVATGASVAGAVGGCQAECGTAAAMAAAGLAFLMGQDTENILDAAALSLKNCLGLACDPVAGLVEVPCVKRNGFMAANALTAASMCQAGIKSVIPFDEVVMAMKMIGDAMPASLKESAEGGLAITPSGKAFRDKI